MQATQSIAYRAYCMYAYRFYWRSDNAELAGRVVVVVWPEYLVNYCFLYSKYPGVFGTDASNGIQNKKELMNYHIQPHVFQLFFSRVDQLFRRRFCFEYWPILLKAFPLNSA